MSEEEKLCPKCGKTMTLVAAGWYCTKDDLVINPATGEEVVPEWMKPPSQEELKRRAAELYLFDDSMSDEEISAKIREETGKLATHEAGTGWLLPGVFLGFRTTDLILSSGLKALIVQNKIIARQNELILRQLRRLQNLPDEPVRTR